MTTVTLKQDGPATGYADTPRLDDDGLLRYRGGWVSPSPKEELILRPLLDRYERVVTRQCLANAVWPGADSKTSALKTFVRRLRQRVEPLGLTVAAVRSRGFIMEPISSDQDIAPTSTGASGGHSEGRSWLIS